MIRPPNSRHTPNLENILNRGRRKPTWRDRLADWWDDQNLIEVAFSFVIIMFGLLLLTLLVVLWGSIASGNVTLT